MMGISLIVTDKVQIRANPNIPEGQVFSWRFEDPAEASRMVVLRETPFHLAGNAMWTQHRYRRSDNRLR